MKVGHEDKRRPFSLCREEREKKESSLHLGAAFCHLYPDLHLPASSIPRRADSVRSHRQEAGFAAHLQAPVPTSSHSASDPRRPSRPLGIGRRAAAHTEEEAPICAEVNWLRSSQETAPHSCSKEGTQSHMATKHTQAFAA